MRKIILLIGFTAIWMTGCKHENHHQHPQPTYTATYPILKDTTLFHEYVSQIHSFQHIELRTMEKGYVEEIYIDEGQAVKKGQVLFQITPIVYRVELKKAQAEVNYAEIEYRNTKALADSNIVSSNELAMAEAELEKAKANLALATAHMEFTQIKAPFDGIIGRFNDVRLGSLVDEGELLTTLSDNHKMWVYFNVPEAEYLDYARRPRNGEPLAVRLQLANGKMFEADGWVETIEADFNNETGNIAFRATFPNSEGILRNGETGNILMPVEIHNAMLIPQKATFEVLDRKYVYVVNDDGSIQSKEIQISNELPHLYVVSHGLVDHDVVLVDGLRKVKNGDYIDVKMDHLEHIISEMNGLHAE